MLRVLILISVFYWVNSIPCPQPNPPEFILGYPLCKNGYRKLFDCDFKPNVVLKYCYKSNGLISTTQTQPKITTTPQLTTTTQTMTPTQPTTSPKPTTTTAPTTTPKPTTTPEPTTTQITSTTIRPESSTTLKPTTTPKPTTTVQSTTTPGVTTTVIPSTTPKKETCGMYPVSGKMWNADITTDCQPWLAAFRVANSLVCNAVLVNENTLLTDSSCIDKRKVMNNMTVSIGGNKDIPITSENIIFPLFGKGISVVKLREKVDTSMTCMKPVCLPQSYDDYDGGNCKVSAYGAEFPSMKTVTYIRDIALIPKSTCLATRPTPKTGSFEDTPDTLCSYPFVQGSSPIEKGGMLICKSKSRPSQWMLAGLTYDISSGNKKANQPVYYWDITKTRKIFEPIMQM